MLKTLAIYFVSHCSMFARHVRFKLATSMRAVSRHEKPQIPTQDSSILMYSKASMDDHRTPEWSCSEVLQLIREYGNRPELWDPECEDYKNRFKKHHKWMELAAIFKCSKLEVERKMKILNSQYRRERLKAVRMRKLGKTHRVTWYGYKAFSFMGKQWVRYKNRRFLADSGVVKQENSEEASKEPLIPFFDDEDIQENLSEDPISGTDSVPQQPLPAVKLQDEWGLFGELVAHALRKFPDDRTRCIIKHKINTVIYEAELAMYDKSD